jgi:hypothetical protein
MLFKNLFLAKRLDNGEVVEGNLVLPTDVDKGWEAIIIPNNCNMFTNDDGDLGFENWYRVDKDTVCAFTSFTDLNDVKIFKGSIVYDSMYRDESYIVWENGAYYIKNDNRFPQRLDKLSSKEIKVVGHIFKEDECN